MCSNEKNNEAGREKDFPISECDEDELVDIRDVEINMELNKEDRIKDFLRQIKSYGYKKEPKNKNHLVIDEYAAEIVRLVFKLKMDGMGSMHIALKLDEMGVLPPMEYKLNCGFNFACGFRENIEEKWSVTAVNRILTNELYTDQMVQGKTRKINYKVKQSFPVEREEWIRMKGTHDAIISEDVIDQEQRLMKVDTCSGSKILIGLISGRRLLSASMTAS